MRSVAERDVQWGSGDARVSRKSAATEFDSASSANLLRTLLTAAVETGALEAMPDLPKAPPPGRKVPSAPSTDEVNAMLANATGWLSVAVALGALAGLRQGEVRALEVRDVDLKQGIITVRWALSENRPVAPKSGDERVIPIGAR